MVPAAPSAGPDLRGRIEAHLTRLPVLPQALARVLTLDPEADDYFEEVVDLLESEPNFAARVFMAANSVASAPTAPVSTLRGAVTRIGSQGATNLVLALSVTTVFVPRDPWEQSLWRHGVQVAHAARALATRLDHPDLDPETVYASALLHDIGRFVMFQEAPEELRLIDEGDWHTPQELIDQEEAIAGMTHPEIGALACTKWGLPDVIVGAVGGHHDRLTDGIRTAADLAVVITRIADLVMFPSAVPGTPGLWETTDADGIEELVTPMLPPGLELTGPQLAELIRAAAEQADAACEALGLGPATGTGPRPGS